MRQPITMPALSDTMNNGRLTKWLRQPGDPVKKGEAVAEVETDKAVMEVEAFHDGYIAGPLAATDQDWPVGATIGFIADTVDESASAPAAAPPPIAALAEAPAPVPQTEVKPAPVAPPAVSAVVAASRSLGPGPARRVGSIAFRSGGSPEPHTAGPDASADSVLALGPPFQLKRASSLREAVAQTMIASVATPSFHVTARLPLQALMTLTKTHDLSLVLTLARACALAIKVHPLINAAYTPQGLAQRERIDIGIAVDSVDGLITPVLRDVAERPLKDLANDWRTLHEKVQTRRLVPADYRGATFYLSDLGVFPVVQSFDSIIPHGASAILSVAAADGGVALGTLTCDHRVIFGGDAARFLQTLVETLSSPATLINEDQAT